MGVNFRAVVDAYRRRGKKPHEPSVRYEDAARAAGMSRPHLYALMAGAKNPPDHTIERIALAFELSATHVRSAIAESRRAFRRASRRRAVRAFNRGDGS